MGIRYFIFRLFYELKRKSGLLRKTYPQNPERLQYPDFQNWKSSFLRWPWGALENLDIEKNKDQVLAQSAKEILENRLMLFNSIPYQFLKKEDWITNPDTGFVYDKNKHWTKIADFDQTAGDIKYVWEKSRFSFLHSILRYDHHFEMNHSEWVFKEIEGWMEMNPINSGPNFRCSQEISLRTINWLGAISFYQNSNSITESRWKNMVHYMYWQVHHVRQNIQFSRIAVRNNHAITECLTLYIFGTLFPQLPHAQEWKEKGKKWFEEEIEYQVYPDGSYLQFSMNYHRVVVQLLTLAIRFSDIHKDKFSAIVYTRAAKSLDFLKCCHDPISGQLPNYGANDGALFFQFSNLPYRVFTSQLNALQVALYGKNENPEIDLEESQWFGAAEKPVLFEKYHMPNKAHLFSAGGFATIQEEKTLTFFRCGRHEDRPSQADNLHVDIWHEGENIFRDGGTYKYNAEEEDIKYFFGTRSHNAIMVNGEDQMRKGPRFVWLNWSQAIGLSLKEDSDFWKISGEAIVFDQLKRRIIQKRIITKSKTKAEWKIEDSFTGLKTDLLELLWHPSEAGLKNFEIIVKDGLGNQISPELEIGFVSEQYGKKIEAPFYNFKSESHQLTTIIYQKPKN